MSRRFIGIGLFVMAFVGLRLLNLGLMPPYVDEGLHITRAFNILAEQTLFVYTEGGKYLHLWLLAPVVSLGDDAYWNARVVSVLLGLLSAGGCYWLGLHLFKRWEVGLAAAMFYAVIPYAFFLDRLALNDSMLGTLAIAITLASLFWQQQPTLPRAALVGLSLGLIGLTKLNGLILWSIPLLMLIFAPSNETPFTLAPRQWLSRLWESWLSVAVMYGLAALMIMPLAFAIPAHLDGPATKTWLLDAAVGGSFWTLWTENVARVWGYFHTYLTWPIFVSVLLGLGLSLYQRHRAGLLLSATGLLYVLVFIVTTVYIQSRYLFAVIPLLLVVGGYGFVTVVDVIKTRLPKPYPLSPILYTLIVIPALIFNYHLLTDPTQAPLRPFDRWFFVDGWTSGYGLYEVSDFLEHQAAEHGEIAVVRNDSSGLAREGLDIKLGRQRERIDLVTLNLRHESANRLTELLTEAPRPVFVVLNLPLAPGAIPYTVNFEATPFCHPAATFYKPDQFNYIGVYQCAND